MTDPEPLPQNPAACRTLTDVDSRRLQSQDPHMWRDPSKECLTCLKKGTVMARSRTGQVRTYACDCVSQWLMYQWLLNAGIGLSYQRLSWSDVDQVSPNVLQAVLDFIDSGDTNLANGFGLTLWSPNVGTGKTMLATLLLKRLLAQGHDGYFISFNEMLDVFSAGWRNEDEREWFIRRVRNVPMLVVDDIGRENRGRASVAESMFDNVIRHRVASAKTTIITTNYTPELLVQAYGGNIASLLSHNTYVEVAGRDYRQSYKLKVVSDAAVGISRLLCVS